ncbi:MAG TPA: ATP-binding cassette domain-containing protein, partial [Bacteroidia bacterium]|nr:ATP-binding cassette domain-containing protein [Bacteroidia bacterium]
MSDALLEVKNLTVDFKSEDDTVRAVDGINFTLNRGESLGIVGESGSGKTVSSLALMRLIP